MAPGATSEAAASPEVAKTTDELKTVFVIGLGMVGIGFIEKMLNLDEDSPKYKILTCGEESHLAYNRVGLTEYFEHRSIDKLYLNTPEWYAEHVGERFQYHLGEQVRSINPSAHTVSTSKGNEYKYDVCVVATGSTATVPPYVSEEQARKTRGVFVYRNIADLDAIMKYAEREDCNSATVVGGGLLGLEAAKAVYDLPTVPDVTIINRQKYPLSRQLDAEAGEMVLRKIEAMGVQVITNVTVTEMLTRADPENPGHDVMTGFAFSDGEVHETDMVIYAIGIKPRDEVALASGIKCAPRGGIIVGDDLMTSAPDVYAVGECASWKNNTYGLIGPGIEMADILAFNLTQTQTNMGSFKPRKMNDPDLSTKLKLMGVDVASFGDYFADQRAAKQVAAEKVTAGRTPNAAEGAPLSHNQNDPARPTNARQNTAEGIRRKRAEPLKDEPVKCLTYKDPFGSRYKKYIFSADGKYLLGGMMIGDVDDFVKLVSIVKKRKPLEVEPAEFIVGQKKDDDGADLDDDTVICSCHAVTKGAVVECVKGGMSNLADVKKKTKATTGCGGCSGLVEKVFKAQIMASGAKLNDDLCVHFKMPRTDLFNIISIKKLRDFTSIMREAGTRPDAVGCEICKPAIGSILSSLYNEHVMEPVHHANQDTNDRFMANIQRNGTFSVVPRMAGGEVMPEHLIVIGQLAKKYGLYTKITGGQRIDLFGANKQDLPAIWEALVEAGMESGHAYGKSLRTVKSCVGTTWCRYGIGDSVGMAVQLENRYKGLRSPHKIKGGVSGCVRECAEAQNKDFGLIATDKGWNLYIAGNGGATPVHAKLFATDVPPNKVVRIIDRYLMFYIRTADRLMRTARWLEQFEGGIEKLRKIVIDDELGICADLDQAMDEIVSTYECEWTKIVNEPERKKQFRQFVNTEETEDYTDKIEERGQTRPADWPKNAFPGVHLRHSDIASPVEEWKYRSLCTVDDLMPTEKGTTSAAVKYGETRLAIFHVPNKGYYASQQMCPHRRAFVLEHGIIGDDPSGKVYVSCPLHKRNFTLEEGDCINDDSYKIMTFQVREVDGRLEVLLPEKDAIDQVLATDKWMVKAATAEAFGRGSAGQIDIVGPNNQLMDKPDGGASCGTGEKGASGCGSGTNKLDW